MCKGVFRWKLSEPNIYSINTSNVIGMDLYAVGVTRHFGFFQATTYCRRSFIIRKSHNCRMIRVSTLRNNLSSV